jgi:hypothetical protein
MLVDVKLRIFETGKSVNEFGKCACCAHMKIFFDEDVVVGYFLIDWKGE